MPTYLQLAQEPVWGTQYVPPVLTAALIVPLRHFYGLGPASIGAPGDNNHLYGRHRSYNWDRQSSYCTNRSYGTTDGRDQGGDRNWYRAVDVGITGQTLYDACRRVDAAVRAGQLPGVAEWFGTFDGVHVVGWFQGQPSSSDSSHLYHLHVGVWNQYANDPATMQLLYQTITEEDDDMGWLTDERAEVLWWRVEALLTNRETVYAGATAGEPNQLRSKLAEIDGQIEALAVGGVDVVALAAALVADPAFKAALDAAAFGGAQRAEDE